MSLLERPVVRVGFACVTADGELSTNHTLRLSDLSEERLTIVAHRNLDDLERILFVMSRGPLRLFRLGSSLVPLASHDDFRFDWRPSVAARLRDIARRYVPQGFRFSMHPGQYTVLNSPNPEVVRKAVNELNYSCEVLDLMDLNAEHKVVIHGGGLYEDRAASTSRLIEKLKSLPAGIRYRLVLENDERYFSLAQILEVACEAELPVVFDLHHHRINPGEGNLTALLNRVRGTWNGRPKVHLSSQKPGARMGAHDDMLHESDLAHLSNVLPFEADLMVEAKQKDVAALHAWNWLQENGKLAGDPLFGRQGPNL